MIENNVIQDSDLVWKDVQDQPDSQKDSGLVWKDVGQQPVQQIQPRQIKFPTIEDARNRRTPELIKMADGGSDSKDVWSRFAVRDFMFDSFELEEREVSLNLGKQLYNDKNLTWESFYGNLQRDNEAGTLLKRFENAEWESTGAPPRLAQMMSDFNNSEFMQWTSFLTRTPAEGLVKAIGGAAVGTTSLFLPEAAEKAIGLDKGRAFVQRIEDERNQEIMDALLNGEKEKFYAFTASKFTGDMYGNLFVMKQALKAANAIAGGNLTLVQKDAAMLEVAKNTATKALVFGLVNFLKTDGTLAERSKAFGVTQFYMNTPSLSSMANTNVGAFFADLALNTGISMVWDNRTQTLKIGGSYSGLVEESKELAEQMGIPNEWVPILVSKLIPVAGPDVIFAAMTRSASANARQAGFGNTSEAARLLSFQSNNVFSTFKSDMQKNYGDAWLKDMNDSERVMYESLRKTNADLSKGILPEQLQQISKSSYAPRTPVEAGREIRRQIVDGEVLFRDSEGKLRNSKGVLADERPAIKTESKEATDAEIKEVELKGEDEALLESTYKAIFSQSKKARSKAFDDATKEITDARKLMKGLPDQDKAKLVTAVKDVVSAKTEETKEAKRLVLSQRIEEALEFNVRQDLTKAITKEIGSSVHADYAKAIMDIQDMILTDTSPKTAWRLENTREFLQRNPDANIPKELVDKLSKTSVNELSTKELEALAVEVERLSEQGKLRNKLARKQEKEEREGIVTTIKSTAKQAPVEKVNETVRTHNQFSKMIGLKYLTSISARRPWNLIDMLDGGKAKYDGKAYQTFINEVGDKTIQTMANKDARLSAGEAMIKSLDLPVLELTRKVDIQGEKFTVDELLSVYASSKNRLMHNAVLYGNFKGNEAKYKEAVQAVESNAKWKALGDYVVYDYASNYDRIRRATVDNLNKVLGQEENYVPMERIGSAPTSKDGAKVADAPTLDEIASMISGQYEASRKLPSDSFTIDRVNVPDDLQAPVRLGLFDQWERNVGYQEQFIGMYKQVQKLNSILSDKEFRDQIERAYSGEYLNALDKYVESVGNPMSIYGSSPADKYIRNIRKRIAGGYLAYNAMTIAKQIPSLLLYTGQGGGKNMLLAIDDFNSGWGMKDGKISNKLIEFVESKDLSVKHAHIERELMELKSNDKGAYDKILSKITEPGMQGIIATDKMVRTIGWYSVYMKEMQSHGNEKQAIPKARDVTMRTQPAASAKDLPLLYKSGSEAQNILLMFSNQLNQIYNIATYDIPRKALDGDIGSAMAITAGLAANAYIMFVLANKREPTLEELTELNPTKPSVFGDQALNSFPVFGRMIVSGKSGYDAGDPISAGINRATSTLQSMYADEGKHSDLDFDEQIYRMLKATVPFHGLPLTPAQRIYDTLMTGDPMELIGGEPEKPKQKIY